MVRINILVIFTKFHQNQFFTKILKFSEFLDFMTFYVLGPWAGRIIALNIPWHQVKVLPLGRKMMKFTKINGIL